MKKRVSSNLLFQFTALLLLLLAPALGQAQGWRLIGISGQQGNADPDPLGGFAHPDHTIYEINLASGAVNRLFQVVFVNDSQSLGFCPTDGLVYHTGGSDSYSNNPFRAGHDQGGPDILGVGYQDSHYMESIDLATGTTTAIFNAAPCPNPDPTLPCFGYVAPRPNWVLPVEQRDSTQTDGSFRARGVDEYHAARGMAWSASANLFYLSDEHGIFKMTTDGQSTFLGRPIFQLDGAGDKCKGIAFVTLNNVTKLLVGHQEKGALMQVDPATGDAIAEIELSYPPGGGEPVDSFNGLLALAQHPVSGVVYGIRRTGDAFARELVTIDTETGVTTLVGSVGMHMAGIAFVPEDPWNLVGISGQQGSADPDGQGGFAHPDHTLYELSQATGTINKLFQVVFVNDSQSIGYCPDDGLVYHTGGSESYSNNPFRAGHDQGGPDILGVGYQDSQYMESIDLASQTTTPIFNSAPCPNPDPTLPCFGLPAPRPAWLLPEIQRDSTQTDASFRARGVDEYHAVRGMAWSAADKLFYVSDENGIFKLTTGGQCTFLARPAFADGQNDQCKGIAFVTVNGATKLLVGHREKGALMTIDPATGDVIGEIELTYPVGGGEPVDSFNGLLALAQHPGTRVVYGIRRTGDNFARELVTIDTETGATRLVGTVGMHIAGIAFASSQPASLQIRSITRNGNDLTLTWTGGNPPYQVQHRASLSTGNWANVGNPTDEKTATIVGGVTGTQGYFRVSGQ